MSYEIVKKISIDNGEVIITSASNNVYPRYFHPQKSTFLSDILQYKGITELHFEILSAYEQGIFKAGVENKYSRAIKRLQKTEIYKTIDWRSADYLNDNNPIRKKRDSDEYKKIILSALKLKDNKKNKLFKTI